MKKIDILVPDLPDSVNDATIVTWHKKIGDIVNCDDNIVDIETDKVMIEVSSPCNGKLELILEKEGSIVKSQQILGKLIKSNNVTVHSPINKNLNQEVSLLDENKKIFIEKKIVQNISQNRTEYFSPSIRRAMKFNQIDHNTIEKQIGNEIHCEETTKIDNKILDIYPINNTKQKNKKTLEHRVKMTRLRQKISERLLESKKNTAMLTTFNEVNMQSIILLRKKYGLLFEKEHGIKLGFMSFFVKAVTEALKKFPIINAYIDNEDIVYYNTFDISIAISTPRGLITPVLKNTNHMTMSEIEKKIKEFSEKGIKNQVSITELTGGNFTITNGGIFGSLMSTPIINPPQSAILGMHLIQDRPVACNGKIKVLPMMYLALSYDHRLIDGKESVGFLIFIKNILEDFTRISINI